MVVEADELLPRCREYCVLLLVTHLLTLALVAAAVEFDSSDGAVPLSGHQQEIDVHLGVAGVLAALGVLLVQEDIVEPDLGKGQQIEVLHCIDQGREEGVLRPAEEEGFGFNLERKRTRLGLHLRDNTIQCLQTVLVAFPCLLDGGRGVGGL